MTNEGMSTAANTPARNKADPMMKRGSLSHESLDRNNDRVQPNTDGDGRTDKKQNTLKVKG